MTKGQLLKTSFGDLPQWDLSDLYPDTDHPAVAQDLQKSADLAKDFVTKVQGQIAAQLATTQGAQWFADVIKSFEQLSDLLGRLGSFASLVYAWDTSDPVRAKVQGDVFDKINAITSTLVFFELEINRLDDAALESAIASCADLAHFAPWLKDLRLERPYQLEDRVEQLFHEKSQTCYGAWNRLYDETVSALRFHVNGEELTIEPTLNLLQDTNPEVRKAGFEALSKVFKENERIFTLVTNTLAKDKEISTRWRGFQDVADSRHLANRIEGEVVEALVSAVRASFPQLSHRYYKLKAKWFGQEKLNIWDRNAPLPKVDMPIIPWSEACETVLSAYETFSPKLRKLADPFFEKPWIDAPVRPGKAPGAFAHSTVPSAHPYLLLNYMGKPRDVMTLAHELGHGVHQVLSAQQGALMAPTPLTLAETASVFGEMLTFRKLLAQTTDKAQRKALLAGKVEDMINTVVRQIAFYAFERKVHLARKEGELTADDIHKLWISVQAESLGDGIILNDGYEVFWTYISHFIHAPFYVYAYAFGDSLVNALYAVYENSSEGFVERYLALLSAGGAKPYHELLAPFGLDAKDPKFWQTGLSLISSFIDQLEAMED